MKRLLLAIMFLANVAFYWAQDDIIGTVRGERFLPDLYYRASTKLVDVQIRLIGEATPITVVETPPRGWGITGTTPKADISGDGVITWNINTFSGSMTLRYTLRVPDVFGAIGTFLGTVNGTVIGRMTNLLPIQGQRGNPYLYKTYFPIGYFSTNKKWPVLIMAPGLGGDPINKSLLAEKDFIQFSLTIDDYDRQGLNMKSVENVAQRAYLTLDEILANYPVDPTRVYLGGFSAGSYFTMFMAARHPELFAALAPMAGSGVTDWGVGFDADRVVNIPIWYFYSEGDSAVPPWTVERVIHLLQERSASVQATKFPLTTDHGDVPRKALVMPELYEWLLQQQKPILTVVRDISHSFVSQGESIGVLLNVHVRSGETTDFHVEERIPPEWYVSNVNVSLGRYELSDENKIVWTGNNISGTATLSYTLQALEMPSGTCAIDCVYTNKTNFLDTQRSDLLFIPRSPFLFPEQATIGTDGSKGIAGKYGEDWMVVASGNGLSTQKDEFFFIYQPVEGDFRVLMHNPRLEFNWKGYDNVSRDSWAKLGIMARQELSDNSTHAYSMIHMQDQALMLLSRVTQGGTNSLDTALNINQALRNEHNGRIGLKRRGNQFTCFYVDPSGNDINVDSVAIEMRDPVYVGVATTASELGRTIFSRFSDVQIISGNEISLVSSWMAF